MTQKHRKKILLDCDPGHDDMIAIMVACASPEIDLLGITTVAGNQILEKTFQNAQKVLTLIGETAVPLAKGADRPLARELRVAPDIHGDSGLDGAVLPESGMTPLPVSAFDFLRRTLNDSAEHITVVPTGPLTNIATLLLAAPEVKEKIERIVLIGGGIYDSNVTPAAEFNIFVDPEAAKIVFESGLPITQVGLDVTNKSLLTYGDIAYLASLDGSVSRFVAPLLKFFADMNRDNFGIQGAPVHDALAVATAMRPEIVSTKHLNVVIETGGTYTTGATVADVYGVSGRKPNVDLALEVDVDMIRKVMIDTICKLDNKMK